MQYKSVNRLTSPFLFKDLPPITYLFLFFWFPLKQLVKILAYPPEHAAKKKGTRATSTVNIEKLLNALVCTSNWKKQWKTKSWTVQDSVPRIIQSVQCHGNFSIESAKAPHRCLQWLTGYFFSLFSRTMCFSKPFRHPLQWSTWQGNSQSTCSVASAPPLYWIKSIAIPTT